VEGPVFGVTAGMVATGVVMGAELVAGPTVAETGALLLSDPDVTG
jgi:hypothetical protein